MRRFPTVSEAMPNRSVAKSRILSRDLGIFYISWDVFGIFILKIQSRDFFGIFQNSSSKFSNQVFGEIS